MVGGVRERQHGTIWVSCFVRQKLKEFTGYGQTLRVVSLHPDIGYPWHAVSWADGGRLLVCHGGVGADARRVVSVGMDGRGTAVYALAKSPGSPTSAGGPPCGGGHPNSPVHAAVDADNFVVLVDCDNRLLTLLDPDLGFVRDLVNPRPGDDSGAAGISLKDPRRVCLDTDNNRVYVGDGSGSVYVIELK